MTKKRKLGIAATVAVVVVALLYGGVRGLHCYYYPFGAEHRCDKQLWFALREYAEQHGGKFPSGEATPEASLSLLGAKWTYLLHHRGVATETVQNILERGELLTPETCGWNYVEGLRMDSNGAIALFWDKEGLSEIGQRLSGGGHNVTFVNASSEYIPAARWSTFLDEQRRRLSEENRKADERGQPSLP